VIRSASSWISLFRSSSFLSYFPLLFSTFVLITFLFFLAFPLTVMQSTLQGHSQQMIREFQRYKELVQRPNIRKELVSQRETLLSLLSVHIKALREEFHVGSL
jgi:uncharacterized membrane protein